MSLILNVSCESIIIARKRKALRVSVHLTQKMGQTMCVRIRGMISRGKLGFIYPKVVEWILGSHKKKISILYKNLIYSREAPSTMPSLP